jgi:CBS domain-containing protein
MIQPVVIVKEDTTLEDVAKIMLERRIGSVIVVDELGKVRGIVTESDFAAKERAFPFSRYRAPQLFGMWMPKDKIEEIYRIARTMTAKEIMSSPVITLTEQDDVEEVVKKMLHHDINRIPIVNNDGTPVGIIARYDLLRLVSPVTEPKEKTNTD